MTKRAFEEEVRRAGRHLTASSVNFALGFYLESINRQNKEAVRECIQLAGRFEQSFPNIVQTPPTTAVALPPTPAASIGSDLLTSKILPRVEELRQKFFDRTDPPFRTWDEAATWLTESSERGVFEKACQELVEATGFSRSAIERYILIGVPPYLSNIEATVLTSANRTQGRVEVNFIFSDEQWQTAGRELRKALGFSRLKGVTDSDVRLLELVNQVGAPPPKGSKGQKAYWEQLRLVWNADKRNRQYAPGRALEMKYKRLPDKMNRLLPSHPATSVRPPM